MEKVIRLSPESLKAVRTVNDKLASYNIEFTEVTGGTFGRHTPLSKLPEQKNSGQMQKPVPMWIWSN